LRHVLYVLVFGVSLLVLSLELRWRNNEVRAALKAA